MEGIGIQTLCENIASAVKKSEKKKQGTSLIMRDAPKVSMQLLLPSIQWDWPTDSIGCSSSKLYQFCSKMPGSYLPNVPYTSGSEFSDNYKAFLNALSVESSVQEAIDKFNDKQFYTLVQYISSGPLLEPAWKVSDYPRNWISNNYDSSMPPQTIKIDLAETVEDQDSRVGTTIFAIGDKISMETPLPLKKGDCQTFEIESKAWGYIDITPSDWYSGALVELKAAIGPYKNGYASSNLTKVTNYTLILARKKWFYICVVMLLALLGFFVALAVKTNMLRDAGPKPPDGGKKPYSLALTQMATWFFVIMSSWLLLYVVKHTFSTITDSLVILMGISAGTGLGGVAIDSNRKTANTVRRSKGFLRDILSDANGISFHRFQVFAWTVVMVLVFIRQVTAYMVMPEFNAALLTLMGISSGTYLGFKVSEKPGTEDTAPVDESNENSRAANG